MFKRSQAIHALALVTTPARPFDGATTVEFTGDARVIDLPDALGLSLEQALNVSDQLPIWAEFYPTENVQRLWATRHRQTR